MPAGLGLGAFGVGVKSVEILIYIIETTQEVRRLKSECDKVNTIASILLQVLRKNDEVLKDQVTAKTLEDLLEKRAWEVMWKHQLPKLLKDMMTWVVLLITETTAATRSDLLKMVTEAEQSRVREGNDVQTMLEILEEIKKNQDEKPTTGLQVDFREGDGRLEVQKENDNLLAGSLKLSENIQVVCVPVNEDEMRYGKGPRHALIYSKLSSNTLVHRFFGIAQRFGRLWAVMEDLSTCKTLAASIQGNSFPNDWATRLGIVHDIAKTVAYLHSVNLLVKSLSDTTVLLSLRKDATIPILTGVERARDFLEHTTGQQYDVRYEAPEFFDMVSRAHSEYTDIWSLGILLWECLSGCAPFQQKTEIFEGPEAARIRKTLKRGGLPWTDESKLQVPKATLQILGDCCNRRPSLRPSAATVTQSLFDLMVDQALNQEPKLAPNPAAKLRASDALGNANNSSPTTMVVKISDDDQRDLRRLADSGDPLAAFLLGSAVWWGLAEPEDDFDQFVLVAGKDRSEELRARYALPLLEFAAQAGIKKAAEPLMRIHGVLGRLYKAQISQDEAA